MTTEIIPTNHIVVFNDQQIRRVIDAQGFTKNKDAAQRGGAIAGKARKDLELETGEKVVTEENYLHLAQNKVKQLEEN